MENPPQFDHDLPPMFFVQRPAVLTVGILFPTLGTIMVGLRLWSSSHRKAGLGIDDWLILPALVLMTGCGICFIVGYVTQSIGADSPPVNLFELVTSDPPSQVALEKIEFALNLLMPLSLSFIKLSIVFFYRRIFLGRAFTVTSWVIIILVIAWGVSFSIAVITGCGQNLTAWWSSLAFAGLKCVKLFDLLLEFSVSDVIIDFVLLIVPIPLVFRLQMATTCKIAVCGILMVGALAISCGIARMYYCIQFLSPALQFRYPNYNGVVSDLVFWQMIEVGVGVIAACLPMLRPVLHAVATSNILQKVRSALSNARLLGRSKDKSRDRTWKPTPGNAETESQSSQRRIVGCEDTGMQKPQHVESYALGPISAKGGWSKAGETSPGGSIYVEDKTFRSVDQV